MAKAKDGETRVILRKLAIYLVSFYTIYYLVSIILVGAFRAGWDNLGRYPFVIGKDGFNPALGGAALGCWLAMVLTYLCCVAVAYWVVRVTRKTWDYMTTTSLIHFALCCIVNQAFPVNWIWWVTLIVATLLVSLTAEVLIYRLRELKDIELGH